MNTTSSLPFKNVAATKIQCINMKLGIIFGCIFIIFLRPPYVR